MKTINKILILSVFLGVFSSGISRDSVVHSEYSGDSHYNHQYKKSAPPPFVSKHTRTFVSKADQMYYEQEASKKENKNNLKWKNLALQLELKQSNDDALPKEYIELRNNLDKLVKNNTIDQTERNFILNDYLSEIIKDNTSKESILEFPKLKKLKSFIDQKIINQKAEEVLKKIK